MARHTTKHPRSRKQTTIAWLRRLSRVACRLAGLPGLRVDEASAGIWGSILGGRRHKSQYRRRQVFAYRTALIAVEALEYRRVLANLVSITGLQNGTETPGSSNAVTFLISQQTSSGSTTTVTFNLSGTATEGSDYPTLPHSVQIQPGTVSTTLSIPIIDDRLIEPTETVIVQLQTATNPVDPTVAVDTTNGTATRTITDNDSATVTLIPGTVAVTEGGGSNNAQVRLTLTSSGSGIEQLAVPVSATLPGNADYSAVAASFPPGTATGATAAISVTAVDDRLVEPTETFNAEPLQVNSTATVSASGTEPITVFDNDSATVSIATGTTSVTEGGGSSNVTVTLSLSTSGTVGTPQLAVPISVDLPSNPDFTAAAANFAAGSGDGSTASVTVTAVDDLLVEAATESFLNLGLGIVGTNGANVTIGAASGSETVLVNDNDTATVTIPTGASSATEGGATANLPVTLVLTASGSGGSPQLAVPITVALPGNADYSTNQVTFGAGSTNGASDSLVVTATDDSLVEAATETFTGQSLVPTSTASVTVSGSQTIAVNDNDSAMVSINSGTTTVTEGGPGAKVTATLILQTNGPAGGVAQLAVPITVNLPGNADYTATAATFPVGSGNGATADIGISAVDDQLVEPTVESFPGQTVGITSTGGANVTVASPGGTQQINVIDNDTATVSIAPTTNGNEQGPVNGVFTLTQTKLSSVNTVINYSVGGTATSGSDYTPLSGSVTIPAGSSTATITVNVIDDSVTEPTETVTVTLTGISSGNPGVSLDPSPGNQTATLNILDNDGLPTIQLSPFSDSGVSNSDNITNVNTPTVLGTAPPNASIQVLDSGFVIASGVANSSGNWSVSTNTLSNGVHNLTVKATAGTTVTFSSVLSVTIDTQAPNATIAGINPDTGISNTDGITNVGSFTISGTSESNSTVVVFDGGGQVGTVTANSSGGWSLLISGPLPNGSTHSYTVRGSDVAGNTGPMSSVFTVQIDNVAPPIPSTPDLIDADDHGVSNTDNITNVATPTFTSTGEVGSIITLFENGTSLGSGIVNSAGVATIKSSTLADGVHQVVANSTDKAGNTNGFSGALTVTIITVAPNVSPPDLIAASDSGVSNTDNITNINKPTLAGTAGAGVTLDLLDGNTVVASTVVNSPGNWQLTTPVLADGVHNFTARATDVAGNQTVSSALPVTIDTAAPAAPATPILAAADDSGSSNSDHITNITTPHLSGAAEAGTNLTLFDGLTVLATVPVNATGNWSSTVTLSSDGLHTITAQATDTAGNISPLSTSLGVTIDTKSPSPPTISGIAPDTGASSTDGLTNASAITISGTAEAGSKVAIFDGATPAGTATAGSTGSWTVSIGGPLADGSTHPYTAQATDVAGNISNASGVFNVVIDRTPPAKPVISGIATDSGRSATDGITNDQTLTVSGTADPNTTIQVFDGTKQLGTTTAGDNGAWSFVDIRTLADGSSHPYTATAADAAGNVSVASAVFTAQIDITAPLAPVIWAVVTDSKSAADMVDCDDMDMDDMGDPTPVVSGTAEPNSLVALSDNATLLGTVLTDATGNWSFRDTRTFTDSSVHQYTATATDVAGNTGPASAAYVLTIDRAAPAAPQILGISPDNGSSTSDGITNSAKISVFGTAEANALVSVFEGTTILGATTADNNGVWSFNDPRTLADGSTHGYTAEATDLAGNTGNASAVFTAKIDLKPPAAPSTPDLTAASDDGSSNTDNTTSVKTPTFTGTAEPLATVRLLEGGALLGTGTADALGNWSITSASLGVGDHDIAAQAVDVAGNLGPVSPALTVTIVNGPSVALFEQRLIGDTNGDFVCNLQDLANVLNNFGKSGLGDTNRDGVVDAQDLANVVNHLGEQSSSAAGTGALAQTAAVQINSAPVVAAPVNVEVSASISTASGAINADQSPPIGVDGVQNAYSATSRTLLRSAPISERPIPGIAEISPVIGIGSTSWNFTTSGDDWSPLQEPARPSAPPVIDNFFESFPILPAGANQRQSSDASLTTNNSGTDDFFASLTDASSETQVQIAVGTSDGQDS
jgi:Bacterial Ig-like domain/Calx-beta domain